MSKSVRVSEAEFHAYKKVRDSGKTNMLNVPKVKKLSKSMTGITLKRDTIQTIMSHFEALERRYG